MAREGVLGPQGHAPKLEGLRFYVVQDVDMELQPKPN